MHVDQCLRLFLSIVFLTTFAPACAPPDSDAAGAGAGADESPNQTVVLSNVSPRMDTDGQIVDAHDGRIIQFGDHYYWYGTRYGETNGFTTANEYHVYRSDDMRTWEHIGPALADRPEGVYYRPHVIYHEASGKYVFWYNWYPVLWEGHFGVAVSDTPEGPFEIVSTDVQVANSELGVGDFGLFVDDDGTAYISYNTIEGHRVSVEKLSDDYLGSTLENGGHIAQYCEAGSMFRRDGRYYLLTDYTCCFCNQGAGARVYIADDPLGEWTLTNNINRRPGRRAHALTDGESFTTEYVPLNRLRGKDSLNFESLVLEYATAEAKPDALTLHVFTGDRSGQCGQVDNPRVHQMIVVPSFEFSYYDRGWQPLEEVPAPQIDSSNLLSVLTFSGLDYPGTRLRIRPTSDFPYDQVRLSEVTHPGPVYIANGAPGPIIIPAQQTYVMELKTATGTEFIWMGDIWGSASDNVKGHDFQYWSSPLRFDEQGWIERLAYEEEWEVTLPALAR